MKKTSSRPGRRMMRPVAFLTAAQFLWSIALYTPRAHADGGGEPSSPEPVSELGHIDATEKKATLEAPPNAPHSATGTAPSLDGRYVPNDTAFSGTTATGIEPKSVPPVAGADKSGVGPQAISLPQGAGHLDGMGESFSTQLSTGVLTFSVPFATPPARGGVQGGLSLGYSSAAGAGAAGMGWDVGVPTISRQTDRGAPRYDDPGYGGAWQSKQDRFVFSGGQELVPICLVTAGACAGALAGEVMPAWANGWQYFRPRVEGAFVRFFWSPDHRTWVTQDKLGGTAEYGVPLDGPLEVGAVEDDGAANPRIFKWLLARKYDSQRAKGADGTVSTKPVNIAAYKYIKDGGLAHLSEVYDTPPVAGASSARLSQYAHHAHLRYQPRPDVRTSFRRGWRVVDSLRLTDVDVTSKPFVGGADVARELVRRYHLAYDDLSHVSLLKSVQNEGRCSAAVAEDSSSELLPDTTGCPTLPPLEFEYEHVTGATADGSPPIADLLGFEPFDERLHTMGNSPPNSIDESLTDLFDVNGDSLPDVMVTEPALYSGGHGVYCSGAGGIADHFGAAATALVDEVLGATAGTIRFDNLNVTSADVDGDGLVDLVHMPRVSTYAVYSPHRTGFCDIRWSAKIVNETLPPQIDFTKDAERIRHFDVDGDGLIDVVRSSATEMQTWFSLGRHKDGYGRFGTANPPAAVTATLSPDPVRSCVPWSGSPIRFEDPTVKVADMNGDGLADLVRVEKGRIQYWPGRGDGSFGAGDGTCAAGSFGTDREITMASSPYFTDLDGSQLRIADVNGDGLADLVQVRFGEADVWLNVDGLSWTLRHIIKGMPFTSSIVDRFRIVDMNGSGTSDLVWGSGGAYSYVDLNGGKRPWLLRSVSNGLGKTTEVEYASSASLMLAAASSQPWQSFTPMPVHVVVRETTRDHMELAGRPGGAYVTEYGYRDPVYDGLQREFRGFRHGSARRVGDAASPTSVSETSFLLGECVPDKAKLPKDDPCQPEGSYQENPFEALKGLPVVNEAHDESGVYASTSHQKYTLRTLYAGLDGRTVRHAFGSESDAWQYDDGPFVPLSPPSTISTTDVSIDDRGTSSSLPGVVSMQSAGRAHIFSRVTVDTFGNTTLQAAAGCIDGCASADETIYTAMTPQRLSADPGGWMFRNIQSYVYGSKDGTRRHSSIFRYDAVGNLAGTSAELSGSIPLARFHEDPSKIVAPDPPTASTFGTIDLGTNVYDDAGNPVFATGANDRCRSVSYDDVYASLPIAESTYVGAARDLTVGARTFRCGANELASSATYDRGLAAIRATTGVHGDPSEVKYDGFGRLTEVWRTSPDDAHALSSRASVLVEYYLTPNAKTQPWSAVRTRTQDGLTADDNHYHDEYRYFDGLGRGQLVLSTADKSAGDLAAWIASGAVEYGNKGDVVRGYLPWFTDALPTGGMLPTPTSAYETARRDAFSRPTSNYGFDGAVLMSRVYHATSVDTWDAADLAPGPHAGTPATVVTDGHGRTTSLIERLHVGTEIEAHATETEYLPSGEISLVRRIRVGKPETAPVVRWMRYDTLGRLVLNVEPNTSKGFVSTPILAGPLPDTLKAWRYAYDDAGSLVGTSDARGCGINYHYDAGGRLVVEDFSPCTGGQADYSAPDVTFGSESGVEVLHRYDAAPTTSDLTALIAADEKCVADPTSYMGRESIVSDRGARSITVYDGRGRVRCVGKQIAKPGGSNALDSRYAPSWYVQHALYDGADRAVEQSTGAKVVDLLGDSGASFVQTAYSARGTVAGIGGSYGPLVRSITRDAEGHTTLLTRGDAASTTTAYGLDDRRRVRTVATYRSAPSFWSSPTAYSPAPTYGSPTPSSFQLLLTSQLISYDDADNPVEIRDLRTPGEWMPGARPVTRKIAYDDLYRVTRVDYEHSGGADRWVSPFAPENAGATDPRLGSPAPHVAFENRVLAETFAYDWLGNSVGSNDDAQGFYDRSLGAITNGTAASGPYQLLSATNEAGGGARTGRLAAKYDDSGELTALVVRRAGSCLPAGATCSHRFQYDWDEGGRLSRARRWDLADPGTVDAAIPLAVPTVDLRYQYDANNTRVVKTAVDGLGGDERHTVYAFASLELRRAQWTGSDFTRTSYTEVPYLLANGVRLARVAYEDADVPSASLIAPRLHVFFEVADHLGSTALVIDKDSGELVEQGSYRAYGGADTDYRSPRWKGFREDYRFNGKEEDTEVGLQYFEARYYAPMLGRWMSPDPMALHALEADLNLFAFVSGSPLRFGDPLGLVAIDECTVEGEGEKPESFQGTQQEYNLWAERQIADANKNEQPPPLTIEVTPEDNRLRDLALGAAYGAIQGADPTGALTAFPAPDRATKQFFEGQALGLTAAATARMYQAFQELDAAAGTEFYSGGTATAVAVPVALAALAKLRVAAVDVFGAGRALASSKGAPSASSGQNTTQYQYKEPKPGLSGKEGAKDKPSWVTERPRVGESGNQFAKRMMDQKYGVGGWEGKGGGSEYSQIRKWADRSFQDPKPK